MGGKANSQRCRDRQGSMRTHCATPMPFLLEDGMNIVTLKELMGHANIETTMGTCTSASWMTVECLVIRHPVCPMRPACEVADVIRVWAMTGNR